MSVPEEELDTLIVDLIRRVAEEPEMQTLLRTEATKAASLGDTEAQAETDRLQVRLRDTQDRADRLLSALSRGLIEEEEFAAQIDPVRKNKREAQERLAELDAASARNANAEKEAEHVIEMLESFSRVWRYLDLFERREVIRQLVEWIVVDRDDAESGPTKSGNVRTIVRVKVLLLPEQTIVLERHKHSRTEKPQLGFAGLSPRQLAYLHHVDQGKTDKEAADVMNISRYTTRNFANAIRKRVNMQDIVEVARVARGLVRSRLDSLPLEGTVARLSTAHAREAAIAVDPRYAESPYYVSPKLMEVFPLFASGATTKEVAAMTGLPWTTVTGRKQSILEVMDSKTMFEAAQKARKAGLLGS